MSARSLLLLFDDIDINFPPVGTGFWIDETYNRIVDEDGNNLVFTED